MGNVATRHPHYSAMEDTWRKVRDVAEGERAVKAGGGRYLPQPLGMKRADYYAYLQRAAMFPALGRTIEALAGTVLARPPVVQGLSDEVRRQFEDVTLNDESLSDVARWLVHEVLTVGRAGLLLDCVDTGGRPYWVMYRAEDIINWRTARIGVDPDVLVHLVLREDCLVPEGPGGFAHRRAERYRELALGEDGAYRVRLWTVSDSALVRDVTATPWMPGEWIGAMRRGKPLDFIPFTFVGARGITPSVDKPPLEDLADLVLSHFRNSADHELGLFMTALPTPWASGVQGGPGSVLRIGPSTCWMLSENGKAGMLEFSGAGLGAIREAMAAKEKHMAVLGGRLLLDATRGERETATTSRLRYAAEASSLKTIAAAVGAAMTAVARRHEWWQGTPVGLDEVRVTINDELFAMRSSAEDVKALLIMWQSDAISFETFYQQLQRGGWTRDGVNAAEERRLIEIERPMEWREPTGEMQ